MILPTHHDSKRCMDCNEEIPQIRKRCWKCSRLADNARSRARTEAMRRACGIKPRAFRNRGATP